MNEDEVILLEDEPEEPLLLLEDEMGEENIEPENDQFYTGDSAYKSYVKTTTDNPVLTEAQWVASLVGQPGSNIELQTTSTHIQWRVVGGEWANLIALSVITGATGKSVELQNAGGYIQWRLVGDADWINIIALSALTGAAGRGISGTSYNASTGVLTIIYTDNTTYSTGDLRGATGKSQYQSYLDTTTDEPPMTEAVWSDQLAGVLTILNSI